MYGPQNAIPGDEYGTELPKTEVPIEDLAEEKKMAKYSESAEFKRFRQIMEGKITHYEHFLPGGKLPADIPEEERGKWWAVADIVIREFKEILGYYDIASEIVKEESGKKRV